MLELSRKNYQNMFHLSNKITFLYFNNFQNHVGPIKNVRTAINFLFQVFY